MTGSWCLEAGLLGCDDVTSSEMMRLEAVGNCWEKVLVTYSEEELCCWRGGGIPGVCIPVILEKKDAMMSVICASPSLRLQ